MRITRVLLLTDRDNKIAETLILNILVEFRSQLKILKQQRSARRRNCGGEQICGGGHAISANQLVPGLTYLEAKHIPFECNPSDHHSSKRRCCSPI